MVGRLLTLYPQYDIMLPGHGSDIVLVGGILEAVHPKAKGRIVNLCGRTPLRVLAKIVEKARLLVGTDSLGIHVAAAVGTPNVCLLGGGHFGRVYPYGDPRRNRIVCNLMGCYGCNWKCLYDRARCIVEIGTDAVWDQVTALLSEGR